MACGDASSAHETSAGVGCLASCPRCARTLSVACAVFWARLGHRTEADGLLCWTGNIILMVAALYIFLLWITFFHKYGFIKRRIGDRVDFFILLCDFIILKLIPRSVSSNVRFLTFNWHFVFILVAINCTCPLWCFGISIFDSKYMETGYILWLLLFIRHLNIERKFQEESTRNIFTIMKCLEIWG